MKVTCAERLPVWAEPQCGLVVMWLLIGGRFDLSMVFAAPLCLHHLTVKPRLPANLLTFPLDRGSDEKVVETRRCRG